MFYWHFIQYLLISVYCFLFAFGASNFFWVLQDTMAPLIGDPHLSFWNLSLCLNSSLLPSNAPSSPPPDQSLSLEVPHAQLSPPWFFSLLLFLIFLCHLKKFPITPWLWALGSANALMPKVVNDSQSRQDVYIFSVIYFNWVFLEM